MDLSQSTLRIEKLTDSNYHTWKTRIQLVLALKDVDKYLLEDSPSTDSPEHFNWIKADTKAKALIALTLSDHHLEQVQHASSSKHMWQLLCDIYEKHTLLNKFAARRRFYTAKMDEDEKILPFASRIRQLASTLKSMNVPMDESEMAMAFLNGLPDRFDSLISALHTLETDSKSFTMKFVQSRCLQEEQRYLQRHQDALLKSEAAALFASRGNSKSKKANSAQETCIHCGKHRDSSRCYKRYPHLAPPGHPYLSLIHI